MKTSKFFTLLLAFSLLLFALASFLPCLDAVKVSAGFYDGASIVDADASDVVRQIGYAPVFCCIVILLELLLLLPAPRVWLRVTGLLLNCVCTALPLPILNALERLFADLFPHDAQYRYSLNTFGYGIIVLGCLILLFYCLSISDLTRKKQEAVEFAVPQWPQ